MSTNKALLEELRDTLSAKKVEQELIAPIAEAVTFEDLEKSMQAVKDMFGEALATVAEVIIEKMKDIKNVSEVEVTNLDKINYPENPEIPNFPTEMKISNLEELKEWFKSPAPVAPKVVLPDKLDITSIKDPVDVNPIAIENPQNIDFQRGAKNKVSKITETYNGKEVVTIFHRDPKGVLKNIVINES